MAVNRNDYGEQEAYAVIDNGEIKVLTISDTRRAALVNWLVTERRCMIMNSTTDDQIEQMWADECGEARIGMVELRLAPPMF